MKAVRFDRHGGPEVLVLAEIPDPEPGPGEALVAVRACSVNRLDCWRRAGAVAPDLPLPHVPGLDVAGVVEAVGPGVDPALVGRETLVAPAIVCGVCPACLAGQDSRCVEGVRVVGNQIPGGYAERCVVPARNCLAKPAILSFEEAASLPVAYLTAWHMIHGRAVVRPGETVLVWAAGSGVGVGAVQIAAAAGARTIAVASTDGKVEQAMLLGADESIVHRTEDVTERTLALTGGRGADVIVDAVGEATFPVDLAAAAPGARIVLCGTTTGSAAAFDIRDLFARELSIHGAYLGSRRELGDLLRMVEAGKIVPVIDRTFPLEEAAEAHRRIESGAHFGKIVLVTS